MSEDPETNPQPVGPANQMIWPRVALALILCSVVVVAAVLLEKYI